MATKIHHAISRCFKTRKEKRRRKEKALEDLVKGAEEAKERTMGQSREERKETKERRRRRETYQAGCEGFC